jgi:glucose dehydrogenase
MLEEILENHPDETFLKADGFDEAIIGLDETSGRLIYSVTKCIECLMEQGMTDEEASEYFYYNVSGAYMGEQTPIFCTKY